MSVYKRNIYFYFIDDVFNNLLEEKLQASQTFTVSSVIVTEYIIYNIGICNSCVVATLIDTLYNHNIIAN